MPRRETDLADRMPTPRRVLSVVAVLVVVGTLPWTARRAGAQPLPAGVRLAQAVLGVPSSDSAARQRATVLARILADDVTWMDGEGRVHDRPRLLKAARWLAQPPTEAPQVRDYGDAVVLLCCETSPAYLQVWALVEEAWQLVAHQSAPGEPVPPALARYAAGLPADRGPAADLAAVGRVQAAMDRCEARAEPETLEQVAAEEFVRLDAAGRSTRADLLRLLRDSLPPDSLGTPRARSTRVYGRVAITVSIDARGHAVSTTVFARQREGWRAVAELITPRVLAAAAR